MGNPQSFREVLEAVNKFSLEEQEMFMEILHRRLIERRREGLAQDIQQAQQEFQAGHCRPTTPEELVREILT